MDGLERLSIFRVVFANGKEWIGSAYDLEDVLEQVKTFIRMYYTYGSPDSYTRFKYGQVFDESGTQIAWITEDNEICELPTIH